MPIYFNLVAAALLIAAFFVGIGSQEVASTIAQSRDIVWPKFHGLGRRLEHWSFCLPFSMSCLVLDLAWRFARRRSVPGRPLWHPLAGGHVFLVPVWLLGLVVAAVWATYWYVETATR